MRSVVRPTFAKSVLRSASASGALVVREAVRVLHVETARWSCGKLFGFFT
jgi:hypothetical protein